MQLLSKDRFLFFNLLPYFLYLKIKCQIFLIQIHLKYYLYNHALHFLVVQAINHLIYEVHY